MKKSLTCVAVLVLMLGVAGPVLAGVIVQPDNPPGTCPTPAWWQLPPEDPTQDGWFQKAGTLTYENTVGGGGASGTLSVVDIPNVERPNHYKQLYLVMEWDVEPDAAGNGAVNDVRVSWAGHEAKEPMQLVLTSVSSLDPNYEHREYRYLIPAQPPYENLYFAYEGVDLDEKLTLHYHLQTQCFSSNGRIPEPASGLMLLAGGGLASVLRKKRR